MRQPGRSGLQSQLHRLCLPKQHPGLRRVKKPKRFFLEPEEPGFSSLYSSCCMCCPCSDRVDLALLPSAFLSLGFPGLLLLFLFPARLSLPGAPHLARVPRSHEGDTVTVMVCSVNYPPCRGCGHTAGVLVAPWEMGTYAGTLQRPRLREMPPRLFQSRAGALLTALRPGFAGGSAGGETLSRPCPSGNWSPHHSPPAARHQHPSRPS